MTSLTDWRLWVVATPMLLVATGAAQPALAQCDNVPLLTITDSVCDVDAPCEITIVLDTAQANVASVAATIGDGSVLACTGNCSTGEAAANGSCTLNAANCRFIVVDLAPPLEAFGNGDVAHAEVVCSERGLHLIDLRDVSFGNTQGLPVDGCSAPGVIQCGEDPCSTAVCGAPITMATPPKSSDALFTLRSAVGSEACLACSCDVDDDGQIAASDALRVLRAAVGLGETLSCPAA